MVQENNKKETKKDVQWGVTRGVEDLHSIIKITLMNHYERMGSTFKLLMLKYTNKEQTELAVIEAEPMDGECQSMFITAGSKYWTFKTGLLATEAPNTVAVCKVDNTLVLMSGEEFFDLWNQAEDQLFEKYS